MKLTIQQHREKRRLAIQVSHMLTELNDLELCQTVGGVGANHHKPTQFFHFLEEASKITSIVFAVACATVFVFYKRSEYKINDMRAEIIGIQSRSNEWKELDKAKQNLEKAENLLIPFKEFLTSEKAYEKAKQASKDFFNEIDQDKLVKYSIIQENQKNSSHARANPSRIARLLPDNCTKESILAMKEYNYNDDLPKDGFSSENIIVQSIKEMVIKHEGDDVIPFLQNLRDHYTAPYKALEKANDEAWKTYKALGGKEAQLPTQSTLSMAEEVKYISNEHSTAKYTKEDHQQKYNEELAKFNTSQAKGLINVVEGRIKNEEKDHLNPSKAWMTKLGYATLASMGAYFFSWYINARHSNTQ